MITSPISSWLKNTFKALFLRSQRYSWLRHPSVHKFVFIAALTVFLTGCVISFRRLEVSPTDLVTAPLLLLALLYVPLTIGYSAINMMLMGKAANVRLGFVQGVRISVFAQVVELLPVPGGAIVRMTALMKAGSSVKQSAGLVLAFSLLWIAVALCGVGIGLADKGWFPIAAIAGGVIVAFGIYVWLAVNYGHAIALAATGLRIGGICLVTLRLVAAFAAVGVNMPWIDGMSFAFAAIAGSAASIVPAGLGVSEGLSALLAVPSGIEPAAAFLAAALSRLIGFAINMLLALGFVCFFPSRFAENSA